MSLALLLAALSLWCARDARGVAPPEIDQDASGAPYVAGELVVVYEPGIEARAADRAPANVDGEVEEELPAVDAQVVEFPEVKDEASDGTREEVLQQKKDSLERQPGVVAADYNYLRSATFTPDDPAFPQQYGLENIRAPEAWDTTRGVAGARISIVDTGIDVGHPDLRSKIVAQRSFVGPAETPSGRDTAGHGTAVAGVAAAVTNNDSGIAGTCPNCSLMAAKVGDSLDGITVADEVQGINWSTDNGADVINISLGGAGAAEAEKRAVSRARNNGVVVVASAGNDGSNRPSYPAAYPGAISVAATDRTNDRADFSNYHPTVDLTAPGVRIRTTDIRSADGFGPSGYTTLSGTSFSSPFTAGLAGLLVSQGRSADAVRGRMENTAVDLGRRGKDPLYGSGLIDAAAAVSNGEQPPPETPPDPPSENTAPEISVGKPDRGARIGDRRPTVRATVKDGPSELRKADVTFVLDGDEKGSFDYVSRSGRLSYRPAGKLAPGRHTVRITARDEQGRSTTAEWSFSIKSPRKQPGASFPFNVLPGGGFPLGMFR